MLTLSAADPSTAPEAFLRVSFDAGTVDPEAMHDGGGAAVCGGGAAGQLCKCAAALSEPSADIYPRAAPHRRVLWQSPRCVSALGATLCLSDEGVGRRHVLVLISDAIVTYSVPLVPAVAAGHHTTSTTT